MRQLKSSEAGSDKPQQVVLVHGTFASSADDCGTAWWQVNSPAYRKLQKQLPSGVSLAAEGQVFRWSGDNNERARSKAAADLLDHLDTMEGEGTPYHLIGHSHGGSVIWQALKLAKIKKRSLKHLQSWSTVGTPFLRHRTRSPWNAVSVGYMILATALLIPFVKVFWWMMRMPSQIGRGELDGGIVLKTDAEVGLVSAMLRAPILALMEFMGVVFTNSSEGIRMGSYDPESGQPFGEFLFQTVEGWIILGGVLLFGYISLLLGSWCIRPVLASLRIRFESRAERKAMQQFGTRWLGIWSPDDEAINGLRATLDLSVSFVGKLVPRERVYFADSIALVSRPWFWLVAPIYNGFFRPSLDTMIRGFVVKTAQGNNRPAAEVVDVAPCPLIPPEGPDIPPLPAHICSEILDEANESAQGLGPKLRNLIAQPSFVSSLDKFGKELSGKELVHTSYFDHDPILRLLTMNIIWSNTQAVGWSDDFCSQATTNWFVEYKQRLIEQSQRDVFTGSSDATWPIDPSQRRQAA